jgi:hypothetical protein
MAETFEVTTRGVGKPDYSREISLGQTRPGISLKYNQTLIVNALVCSALASPYPWCRGALAVGETAPAIDASTGLALPYTVPVGYTYSIIDRFVNFSQDIRNRAYIDGFLLLENYNPSGSIYINRYILALSTATLDPTAITAHTVDTDYTNISAADAYGNMKDVVILEAVGTPPLPDKKDVRCKWCGYVEKGVHVNETLLNCPKCGKKTIYFNIRQFVRSA